MGSRSPLFAQIAARISIDRDADFIHIDAASEIKTSPPTGPNRVVKNAENSGSAEKRFWGTRLPADK
jgi:hypothetical protein